MSLREFEESPLVVAAGGLWREATQAEFLSAIRDGNLPRDAFQPARSSPPRLVAVDGVPLSSTQVHSVGAQVELELSGVFDPSGLRAELFPLRPQRGELLLDGVFPAVSASLVGERTIVQISLPPGEPELVLRTRDWELRDVAGRRLDPSVVIHLARH